MPDVMLAGCSWASHEPDKSAKATSLQAWQPAAHFYAAAQQGEPGAQ
jgi:hypothetical protein